MPGIFGLRRKNEFPHQTATNTLAPRGGIDGKGQQFRLIRDCAAKKEAVRAGKKEAAAGFQKRGEFIRAPWPGNSEAAGMQRR